MDWSEIGKWLLAALGVIAAGITLKIVINRRSNNSRTVVKGNQVDGDIVIGNKTTNSHNSHNKR